MRGKFVSYYPVGYEENRVLELPDSLTRAGKDGPLIECGGQEIVH